MVAAGADWFSDASVAEKKWTEFKRRYALRPFCLLAIVNNQPASAFHIPDNFISDNTTVSESGVPTDDGDVKYATNWDMKCGMDTYTSAVGAWVGLYIADETAVSASRDRFISNMKARNIKLIRVYSSNLDWIVPFTAALVPGT